MKVLAIDDQLLVLLPLENKLKGLGYDIKTTTYGKVGKSFFKSFQPDLVIVDLNMPDVSGIDVIKYIRATEQKHTHIMVLSGKTDDATITEAFELGVTDFMKKPLSLQEICSRVKRIIGQPVQPIKTEEPSNMVIHQHCVGVVIPCYNEEERLHSGEFSRFIAENSGYHLCFVNDGSTDKTLARLQELRKGKESYISIYDCEKNGGKAEAVRLGMLHLYKKRDLDYIGFLDADLSTNLEDFNSLVQTIEKSDFKIVSGSRIDRMGANITKESARKIISLTINFIIKSILSMNFKDTQCGAKIFSKEVIPLAFNQPFITKWLFDVEIFMRMRLHFGTQKATAMICEKPLERWVHADGSKLSMKDSIKIIGQLAQIKLTYGNTKKPTYKTQLKYTLVNTEALLLREAKQAS